METISGQEWPNFAANRPSVGRHCVKSTAKKLYSHSRDPYYESRLTGGFEHGYETFVPAPHRRPAMGRGSASGMCLTYICLAPRHEAARITDAGTFIPVAMPSRIIGDACGEGN